MGGAASLSLRRRCGSVATQSVGTELGVKGVDGQRVVTEGAPNLLRNQLRNQQQQPEGKFAGVSQENENTKREGCVGATVSFQDEGLSICGLQSGRYSVGSCSPVAEAFKLEQGEHDNQRQCFMLQPATVSSLRLRRLHSSTLLAMPLSARSTCDSEVEGPEFLDERSEREAGEAPPGDTMQRCKSEAIGLNGQQTLEFHVDVQRHRAASVPCNMSPVHISVGTPKKAIAKESVLYPEVPESPKRRSVRSKQRQLEFDFCMPLICEDMGSRPSPPGRHSVM